MEPLQETPIQWAIRRFDYPVAAEVELEKHTWNRAQLRGHWSPAETWKIRSSKDKYIYIPEKKRLVLRRTVISQNPFRNPAYLRDETEIFVHRNEIADDTKSVSRSNNTTTIWTGVRGGEPESGPSSSFTEDVIIIIYDAKALFIRLDGACSVSEIERAFIQINYFTWRDLLWSSRVPTKGLDVYWFRPMDYETGGFLYPGSVGSRLRSIERQLRRLNGQGVCRVTIRNVCPQKDSWRLGRLEIGLVNTMDKKEVIVRDALGEMVCFQRVIPDIRNT